MNYDQVIDKINALEERLDIILLTMQDIGHGASVEFRDKLDRYRTHALLRQRRRDEENEVKSEYFELKTRIAQLEADYPNIVK
jgi:hypothetical protein